MKSTRLAVVITLAVWSAVLAAQPSKGMFVFQNNFWLNLHQFLRGEIYRRRVPPPGIDPASLSDADRAAWMSALEVYTDVAKGDLVFDESATRIASALATTTGDETELPDGLIDARTTAALNAAAPIYRARLWPVRRRDNDTWNAAAKALVDRHGAIMASALSAAYHTTWPSLPYLVEAVGEIGPSSAVTHRGPTGFAALIQPSTASPRNTGDRPLELLFHEAMHTSAGGGRLTEMIEAESARQQLAAPDNLWHFAIMFTSGRIARRVLASAGRPGYSPYFESYDQLPAAVRSAFERDWQPYLDGKTAFEQALHDLVRDAR